jgi:iron complex outermembrane recepter protein
VPYTSVFTDPNGNPVPYDPRFPNDSYFLQTFSEDKQLAWFAEGTYAFTDQWKATAGVRLSRTEFSFNTLTGGPQLFLADQANNGDKKENSFTPKLSLSYQYDPHNLYYFTYAKGFRPGGANNPVPQAACSQDFANFGIKSSPATFNSDTVNSFEVGAKNNIDNRVKIASSIYYIAGTTSSRPWCRRFARSRSSITSARRLPRARTSKPTLRSPTVSRWNWHRATPTPAIRRIRCLSPTGTTGPVVSSGDAITGQSGQPNAPFTATIGLEYKFTAFSLESFVRIDDEYESRAKWPSPQQDPNTLQYDPANYTLSSTSFASARAGVNSPAGKSRRSATISPTRIRSRTTNGRSTPGTEPAGCSESSHSGRVRSA